MGFIAVEDVGEDDGFACVRLESGGEVVAEVVGFVGGVEEVFAVGEGAVFHPDLTGTLRHGAVGLDVGFGEGGGRIRRGTWGGFSFAGLLLWGGYDGGWGWFQPCACFLGIRGGV